MGAKLVVKQRKYVDPDTILDESDLRAIAHARKAEAAGKLIPLEKVMEELELRVRRRAR